MKESDLSKAILQVLALSGYFAFKHWSGPMSRKGVPDILGCTPDGRCLAIEVKVPGRKPTVDQRRFLAQVQERGGIGFVAWSVDDVIRELGLSRFV